MIPPLARSLPVAALLVLFAGACGSGSGASAAGGSGRLQVVATTTQIADFARAVGGDEVEVHQILKPNVDPHDYEPSPLDIKAIAEADVVVKNGVGLERWLDSVISSAGFDGPVVDASRGVTIRQGDGSAEEAAGDPHIWHDPRNAKIMAANIEKAYEAKDPADATAYRASLAAYDAKLDALDADIAKKIDSIPADRRKLVTNHDAFGYYLDRYKLTFVGSIIPSFDTSAELSGRQISDLVARIRATGVTAIFSESSLPPKTAEAIGREAGVKVVAGEDSLYGDTLGPAGSAGATYLQMEEHNTDMIVNALKDPAA
ncbi:metal ABC transporter substrate-binding protein [Microbispora sp. ATCC PTA-5024]|uniref:metal ABC transporter substrate-binding protein n=1 Tax=Microbispora sp. ATCC PTA-5024 TaxID=316330 RepID=UPI0003DD3A09|nr:metal ABC transporter substrate-binding protein [Microbispora sp. ATCC PTA-5024]ETK34190.1 manganese ABC transporter [Microbispora sp. ATCC PTA-5024]